MTNVRDGSKADIAGKDVSIHHARMKKLLLASALFGAAALLTSCLPLRLSGPPLVVSVTRDGEGCRVTVAGEQVTSDRLLEIGRSARSRRGIVLYDRDTPYKCIGGAIFTLQRAGLASFESAMWDGS